jgi:anti-sigma B factor antagonist
MSVPGTEVRVHARKERGQTCILDIKGGLSAFAEDELMEAYNRECATGTRNVILNFAGLEYMSSSGIGLLVTLLIRAQRRQQRLLAVGLTDHYREIFEITRLDEAISLHEEEADALSVLSAEIGEWIR